MTSHVLAIGGGGFRLTERYGAEPGPLVRHALDLTGRDDPAVTALYTATGDPAERIAQWYATWAPTPVRASHLALFPMPNVDDVRAHLLAQDAVYVGGGSVANLLAVWRVHGLVEAFAEAATAGVVLFGVSAGSLCWFEGGTTDSYGPELRVVTGGLGLLPGSNCPHYDSEARRRPTYQRLVGDGTLPPGHAADDGVGLHFVDGRFVEAVSDRDGAAAYRVEQAAGGVEETRIEPRRLPG
jgi:peptidase E